MAPAGGGLAYRACHLPTAGVAMRSPFNAFVGSQGVVPLGGSAGAPARSEPLRDLLWGDAVKFIAGGAMVPGRRQVRSRNRIGGVDEADLGGEALLEISFINVGQGNGVRLGTPAFE